MEERAPHGVTLQLLHEHHLARKVAPAGDSEIDQGVHSCIAGGEEPLEQPRVEGDRHGFAAAPVQNRRDPAGGAQPSTHPLAGMLANLDGQCMVTHDGLLGSFARRKASSRSLRC